MVIVAATGCASPGTPAPSSQAAKLSVATSDIATACGYADELTAFGDHHVSLSSEEAMAAQGASKLAGVYARSHAWIYQGESIGGVVNGSIALLGECGLPGARTTLLRTEGR